VSAIKDGVAGSEPNETREASADSPGNMNLFYTWAAILGPYAAGVVYDRTESYAIVFNASMIALLISTALTALLIKPWAKVGTTAHLADH
jgi:hypothetical protein